MQNIEIYFQKQGSFNNLCGMHAINNLLGNAICNESGMNQICKELSKDSLTSHKHFFGGDYDVNVIMKALQNLGYQCQWLDERQQDAACLDSIVYNEFRVGYIINRQQQSNKLKQIFGVSDRHWLAVKCTNVKNEYAQLDSKSQKKNPSPVLDISSYLSIQFSKKSHILQVLKVRRQQ